MTSRPIHAGNLTLLVVLLSSSLRVSAAAPTTLSTEWASLFNGRDLSGWIVKCLPADREHAFWKVEDGTILGDSMDVSKHDYVWLVSEKEYGDFELELKFQAYRESPGNTGVQIRSRYNETEGWLNGPQVDIHPPGPWRTGMIWDETRGNQRWLYPEVPKGEWVNESMSNPDLRFHYHDDTPAWNLLRITAKGNHLTAILNGVNIMEYDGSGVLDDETHRRLRVGQVGHIALQIHTGDRLRIRYKDIRIRQAP